MTPSRRRHRSSSDALGLADEPLVSSSEPFTPLNRSTSRILGEEEEEEDNGKYKDKERDDEASERIRKKTQELVSESVIKVPQHLTFPKELPPAGNVFRIQRTFYSKPHHHHPNDKADTIVSALVQQFLKKK